MNTQGASTEDWRKLTEGRVILSSLPNMTPNTTTQGVSSSPLLGKTLISPQQDEETSTPVASQPIPALTDIKIDKK